MDHPEEFAVWLAYPDWLDDRGDPCSEFLGCEVDRRCCAPEAAAVTEARLAVLRPPTN